MVKCSEEDLDRLFLALGEPVRRRVVRDLTFGEKSLSDLAKPLPMTMAGVMKHIAVLESAGLVVTEKRGRTRYCRLQPERMSVARDWMEETTRFWTERLESLVKYFEEDL